MSGRYVVAPKREHRAAVGPGWHGTVRATEGVTVLGGDDLRLLVAATPEAARRLRDALGDRFHVEEEVPRSPMR